MNSMGINGGFTQQKDSNSDGLGQFNGGSGQGWGFKPQLGSFNMGGGNVEDDLDDEERERLLQIE
jgi:hypothetical protein